MSTNPSLGRTAVLKIGTQSIGYCKNITVSIDADLIKDYFINATTPDQPAFIASGNKSFKVSIERAWIDTTYANNITQGTALTVEVYPQGTATGKPKITLSNVIFTSYEMTITQDGIIMESMEGEGSSITIGTAS